MKLFRRIKDILLLGHRVADLQSKLDEQKSRIMLLESNLDDLKLMTGRIYGKLLESQDSVTPGDYEFKVFSQYGDDGIIQFLVKKLKIRQKSFVEFGVENYTEANTRFLLLNDNWRGLIIDGSEKNIRDVMNQDLYWKHNLTAVSKFITKDNINTILSTNGFTGEVGLLHIDIDGNDYWVWDAIEQVDPVIVIMEYNAVFGLHHWTVPYDEKFNRSQKHHSNLYFGASLSALNDLAVRKGYSLIGCNSHGNNAYFVKNDQMTGMQKTEPEKAFVDSQFRESRDEQGVLTFISGEMRLKVLKGLPVFNTATGQTEYI